MGVMIATIIILLVCSLIANACLYLLYDDACCMRDIYKSQTDVLDQWLRAANNKIDSLEEALR